MGWEASLLSNLVEKLEEASLFPRMRSLFPAGQPQVGDLRLLSAADIRDRCQFDSESCARSMLTQFLLHVNDPSLQFGQIIIAKVG